MTVEYILLVSLFVLFIMGSLLKGPSEAFKKSGPLLGARVERHLITGEGFTGPGGVKHQWVDKKK